MVPSIEVERSLRRYPVSCLCFQWQAETLRAVVICRGGEGGQVSVRHPERVWGAGRQGQGGGSRQEVRDRGLPPRCPAPLVAVLEEITQITI